MRTFSPLWICVGKKSWKSGSLSSLLFCLAQNTQLLITELSIFDQLFKVLPRPGTVSDVSLIHGGVMAELSDSRKLISEQSNICFRNFLWASILLLWFPVCTCGICSPRMLNISGISFDLTGKSTESGWSTGSELTSRTQGCNWESRRMSSPSSL